MSKKKKWLLRMICIALTCVILGAASVFGLDAYVRLSASPQILTPEQAAEIADVDCILVLGCLVKSGGVPSDMLHDRLRRGVDLYESGAAPKLLMSGDHGRDSYDEVDAMKQFAVDSGIPSTDVFMDHAGFSTYESIYRARDIFQAKKIIIVSQEYHLYRAVYIAQALGLEAYGVSADYRNYLGQSARDFREVLARIKDLGYCIIKPEPTYLGEIIPIFGDGDLTNDESSNFS
jgi:vancomycin permeability regulator SanA